MHQKVSKSYEISCRLWYDFFFFWCFDEFIFKSRILFSFSSLSRVFHCCFIKIYYIFNKGIYRHNDSNNWNNPNKFSSLEAKRLSYFGVLNNSSYSLVFNDLYQFQIFVVIVAVLLFRYFSWKSKYFHMKFFLTLWNYLDYQRFNNIW